MCPRLPVSWYIARSLQSPTATANWCCGSATPAAIRTGRSARSKCGTRIGSVIRQSKSYRAVRFRPIALTALALVVGGGVILLDPIFQGLALAMISGIIVSTALTLGVIPVLYYMYLKAVGPENVVEVEV